MKNLSLNWNKKEEVEKNQFWSDLEKLDDFKDESVEEVIDQLVHSEKTYSVIENKPSKLSSTIHVIGDINSQSELECGGLIEGNIQCTSDVTVVSNTKILGDITARNCRINSSEILGSITCDGKISIHGSSLVKGNLVGLDMEVDGTIEGDIESFGTLELKQNASVSGNIKAQQMSIVEGAIINGKIHMGH